MEEKMPLMLLFFVFHAVDLLHVASEGVRCGI